MLQQRTCNAANEEEDEKGATIASLRCSIANQQEEGNGNFAVTFFFAPSCATKKKKKRQRQRCCHRHLPFFFASLPCSNKQIEKTKKKKASYLLLGAWVPLWL
jgi:hypothetical protein